MPQTDTTITGRVLEALADAGVVTPEQVSLAVEAARETGTTPDAVLLERGLITSADVAEVLDREMGVPRVDLASYTPDAGALALVPSEVALRRGMLPLFEIEGMLTVAVGDPLDAFALDDLADELGLDVEPVLAGAEAVSTALAQYYAEGAQTVGAASPPSSALADAAAFLRDDPLAAAEASFGFGQAATAPPAAAAASGAEGQPDEGLGADAAGLAADYAAGVSDEKGAVIEPPAAGSEVGPVSSRRPPADALEDASLAPEIGIDLDVLALADSRNVALLVNDILEDAARRGASHVHLLPYKDDFFLVYRIDGRLEKIASAPRSLQRPLVEGFRGFASLPVLAAAAPATGRVRVRLADRDLGATVSVVTTLTGQRLVVGLAPVGDEVPGLEALGMWATEATALRSLMERGRGLVVVAAPAAGGATTTVASLLSSAAASGRTVYSVEREPGYELAAVAQVIADPAAGAPASSCLRAGMRQDTDVLALDGVMTAEELGVAMSAAMRGRLVLVTVQAADAMTAIARLLDLGVDRESLASSLTAVIGQRLLRLVCPTCGVDVRSPLCARIVGLGEGAITRAGSGCSSCGGSGLRGATAVFEVLPVNAAVRRVVALGAESGTLAPVARAAGCRPMTEVAVELVVAGRVTPEELDRVMRLSGT
jgi:type II secretory ATPase GspE/PulE/Tfp pilus assembly ATPase PilB-like protein